LEQKVLEPIASAKIIIPELQISQTGESQKNLKASAVPESDLEKIKYM